MRFSADSLFGFDHSGMPASGRAAFDTFAAGLRGAQFGVIPAEGHTDRAVSTACNQTLSQQRAEAVTTCLVNTGGFPADKVGTVGSR